MSEADPYCPPLERNAGLQLNLRSLLRSVGFVAICAGVGAFLGVGVGFLIGVYVPEYIRLFFRHIESGDNSVVGIGIVLGFFQGAGVGGGLAVLLLIIHGWFQLRRLRLLLQFPSYFGELRQAEFRS